MTLIGVILVYVLYAFIFLLFIRLVVDWVQVFARSWQPRGPVLLVLEVVYTVTDPPLRALRRVIPPLRLGAIALDLSFIVLLVACYVLLALVRSVFNV